MKAEDRKILALTRCGMSPEDISLTLEIGEPKVKAAQKRLFSQSLDQGRILTALNVELERLSRMREPFFEKALMGSVQGAQVSLSVHDRMAKLLGINAPDKMQLEQDVTYSFNFLPPEAVSEAVSERNRLDGEGTVLEVEGRPADA